MKFKVHELIYIIAISMALGCLLTVVIYPKDKIKQAAEKIHQNVVNEADSVRAEAIARVDSIYVSATRRRDSLYRLQDHLLDSLRSFKNSKKLKLN